MNSKGTSACHSVSEHRALSGPEVKTVSFPAGLPQVPEAPHTETDCCIYCYLLFFLFFFFLIFIYLLFIWLRWVLVAAHRLLSSCGAWAVGRGGLCSCPAASGILVP